MGDSFVRDYKNTYLETMVTECGLHLISHQGFSGQSQYKIWENFHRVLNREPDVVLIVHTEHSRLYHPTVAINPHIENFTFDNTVRSEIISAAKMYYEHLYDEIFSFNMYKLLIDDIQNKCRERQIKLINMPAFNSTYVNKTYGLWLVSDMGLSSCSKADWPDWGKNMQDSRSNHFTPNGHRILAENIIPHIKTYLNGTEMLSIQMIHPQYFG
jgi:hypothetical protein